MQNFIFISPNFPTNYWQFCRELKNNGMNVLGIGDQPYDELKPELKESLNEYYKVGNLENYDEVYRAVAFLAFKHGRIDWLESNNEYWLERDAALRTDFHITTGFQTEDMPRIKYKSKMKEYYQKAGIATARYHMVDDLAGCKKFIEEVGYPVVVKPDNGVGASDTHKLSSEEELKKFLAYKAENHADVSYIMEEFVRAEVNSYDAIIDGSGNPIFEAGNVSPMSIMDIVNDNDNSIYYIYKIWADMIAFGGTDMPVGEHYYCAFAGRRDGKHFVYSHEQIMQKYQKNMKMVDRIPDALSGAMGNQMYVANFSTREEMEQFYSDVLAVTDPINAKVQKELTEVLALGEPDAVSTKAVTPKPDLTPAIKPTTAVAETKTKAVAEVPTRAVTETPTKAVATQPTKAVTETPTKAVATQPTKAVTKTPTKAVTKTSRKGKK